MQGAIGKFYQVSEWIVRLVYVNLLWIFFTLLGLGIAGLFPATAAMFAVIRKWIMEGLSVPVFTTFWTAYRTEFFKINLLGLILMVIGTILYLDLHFFQSAKPTDSQFFQYLLFFAYIGVVLIYFLVLAYLFPVYVHYKLRTLHYLRYTFYLAVKHPFRTVLMFAGNMALFMLFGFFPGLFPFFGGSAFGLWMMWNVYRRE